MKHIISLFLLLASSITANAANLGFRVSLIESGPQIYSIRLENVDRTRSVEGYAVKVLQERNGKVVASKYELSDSILFSRFDQELGPMQGKTLELNQTPIDVDSRLQVEVLGAIYSDGSEEGTEEGLGFLRNRRMMLKSFWEKLKAEVDAQRGITGGKGRLVAALEQQLAAVSSRRVDSQLETMNLLAVSAEIRALRETLISNQTPSADAEARLLQSISNVLSERANKVKVR